MRIAILRGSPRKNGSSNLLADSFIRGAMEDGHEIIDIDIAHSDIYPCIDCKARGFCGKPCTLQDGMAEIKSRILAADMLVFVTPLYYFGMSAQLKICLHRCCSINQHITEKHMKSALLVSAWNDNDWTMTALEIHYHLAYSALSGICICKIIADLTHSLLCGRCLNCRVSIVNIISEVNYKRYLSCLLRCLNVRLQKSYRLSPWQSGSTIFNFS